MSVYRRSIVPGGTYFFTLVTHDRRPILTSDLGRSCLRRAIQKIQVKRPFELMAIVLLPDHLHAVWVLPETDGDYSIRWKQIKEEFTRTYLNTVGGERTLSPSRLRRHEQAVWQRRFWEHTCRDEDDLKRCVDYIHWNPVKHGLVPRVRDYPWTSFHRFVRAGEYDPDWGGADPAPEISGPEWE